MQDLKKELENIEQEYIEIKQINTNLKNILKEKYDPNINEIIKMNKNLIIENRYISIKNFNVNNLNNEFVIENINLANFNINNWENIIEELKYEIEYLKKEIYFISQDLYHL